MQMFDHKKQEYLIISMILMAILFTATIANAACNPNYNSKQQNSIYSGFINLEQTPDQIARNSETAIINSIIEQSKVSKK
jgi:hypothetical protein